MSSIDNPDVEEPEVEWPEPQDDPAEEPSHDVPEEE